MPPRYREAIPSICPNCGTELVIGNIDHDGQTAQKHCPNKQCPTNVVEFSVALRKTPVEKIREEYGN